MEMLVLQWSRSHETAVTQVAGLNGLKPVPLQWSHSPETTVTLYISRYTISHNLASMEPQL